MKKMLFTLSMALFIGHFVNAQNFNTLWCSKLGDGKSKEDGRKLVDAHNFQLQKTTEPGKLNAIMKWGGETGGSTFSAANLEITNGICESCTPVGQIGAKNPKQNWVIKVTDPSKPVTFAWKTSGTINMCGTGKLVIPRPF